MPPETTDPTLERALSRTGAGIAQAEVDKGPLYRVLGDSKLPVSKATGGLWEGRKSQGLNARGNSETNWDEAIRYYDNDQGTDRKHSGSITTRRLGEGWTETENVVFANCSIMVPMLYAKNPNITVTIENDAQEGLAKAVERLGNKLMSAKTAPGLNFKPKMRRSVLSALLTNSAIIKIGWTQKEDGSEEAISQLQELSNDLESAKTKKEIQEVEGKIKALEEKINLLSPAGPWVRALLPHRIVQDPTSVEPDFSDANWIMEWDHLPTDYINAVYATKQGEEFRSVYEPTHVLRGNTETTVDDTVNNFSLLEQGSMDASSYGFSNAQAFKMAQYTKVWYVWDKTTRRVLMFADNNWKWPLWVWDDPLKLPRFFPYFRLWFHEGVHTNAPKGEVTYYLDQQDAINDINSEIRRGRDWAKRNVLYNKRLTNQEDVEQVLKGPDGTARGIDVPEGMKMEDLIFSFIPPGLKMPEFFSTDSKFAAINRLTGINDAMRGAQFKTNTTNKAVEAYSQNVDIRVDERVDLIEDFIGDIMWNISMLALMNWEREDVTPLIGASLGGQWTRQTDPRTFETMFSARC